MESAKVNLSDLSGEYTIAEAKKLISTIDERILASLYLDYVNNFLTVEKFAEHYRFTENHANNVINKGRRAHEKQVRERKEEKH